MTRDTDVLVFGAGPSGATVATLVAQAGYRTRLLDAQTLPRFTVGESLVPAVNWVLERLGVLCRMDGRGFPRKRGVRFFSAGSPTRPFHFTESPDPRLHETWHVLRSDFDLLLVENARHHGVLLQDRTTVIDILESDGAVGGVVVRDAAGREHPITARFVVDASGQSSLLARRLGERTAIAGLENASVFSHYRNVALDGLTEDLTLIFRLDHAAWFWWIPLPDDVVSIGYVGPAERFAGLGETPTAMLAAAIAQCEPIRTRLRAAEQVLEPRVVRDFSYRAQRDGGPGWALVGDALAFLDPVYSSGLYLALLSGEQAADALIADFRRGIDRPDLQGFSARYQFAFQQFLAIVRAFYAESFHFGAYAKDSDRRQGLVDILTGNVATDPGRRVGAELLELCGGLQPR